MCHDDFHEQPQGQDLDGDSTVHYEILQVVKPSSLPDLQHLQESVCSMSMLGFWLLNLTVSSCRLTGGELKLGCRAVSGLD